MPRDCNLTQQQSVGADGECPGCGGPNPPGMLTCQWCGRSLPQPIRTGPPHARTQHVVVEREAVYTGGRRGGSIVALDVIVITVIVFVASVASSQPNPSPGSSLRISGLKVSSPDGACGLNGDDSGTIDLSLPSGGIPIKSWGLPGQEGLFLARSAPYRPTRLVSSSLVPSPSMRRLFRAYS